MIESHNNTQLSNLRLNLAEAAKVDLRLANSIRQAVTNQAIEAQDIQSDKLRGEESEMIGADIMEKLKTKYINIEG